MSYNDSAGYNAFSQNLLSSTMDFWNDLGFNLNHPKEIGWLEDQLEEKRVVNYSESPERKVADVREEHTGVISAEAAQRLLGGELDEGSIKLLLIDRNSIPHDSYRVSAQLESEPGQRGPGETYIQDGTVMVESAENSPENGYYDVMAVGYQPFQAEQRGGQMGMKELEDNLDDVLN